MDTRLYPQIPAAVFPAVLFAMFCARISSFNQLEQFRDLHRNCWRRWLRGHALPCVDEISYVSERIDLDSLHHCLGHVYSRLKRNKVLGPQHGWMVANIDGHETGASYHRCCSCCLEREVKFGKTTRVQYYHRLVAIQIASPGFNLMLDAEMVEPGEDEVAAALRLVARVVDQHPRSFDVLCADAIYLRPSVIEDLREKGKHLVVVLKGNQPELLEEARTLMVGEPDRVLESAKPNKRCELRDMDGFTTETICEPLRIVSSKECTVGRERVRGEWIDTRMESQWYWATTMKAELADARAIHDFGHGRWKIENEGFNELVTHWHANHSFHHHHNSILVLWLILFMAHAAFHCFISRNVKPELRAKHTDLYFAEQAGAQMRSGTWWPPPT